MPKNLRNKLATFLADAQSLGREEATSRLERLVLDELQFLQTDHRIGTTDLYYIKSRAVDHFNAQNMTKEALGFAFNDNDAVRALAYTQAVVDFMRREGLTSTSLSFDKNKR